MLRKNKEKELSLNHVIITSTLHDRDTRQQAMNILQEFNKNVTTSCFTLTDLPGRGIRIPRDTYILAHRNNIPELAAFHPVKRTAIIWNFNPNVVVAEMSHPKQNDLFYGAHGSYVLNIPVGKYAKAWSGNIPLLFDSGPHVIHDQNFRFEPEHALVNQDAYHIQHGTIHILRVPAGKLAKVWIGTEPFLLASRCEPYVFDDAQFKLEVKNGNESFSDEWNSRKVISTNLLLAL